MLLTTVNEEGDQQEMQEMYATIIKYKKLGGGYDEFELSCIVDQTPVIRFFSFKEIYDEGAVSAQMFLTDAEGHGGQNVQVVESYSITRRYIEENEEDLGEVVRELGER